MRVWAVVPAAGVGRRMGGGEPKQYRALLGRRVIEWVLERLLEPPSVAAAVVAVAADDPYWAGLQLAAEKPIYRVAGGAERQDSVRSALDRVAELADPADWVMVHDAARPCLSTAELTRLLATGMQHPDGALLAKPVADTLKRAAPPGVLPSDIAQVLETVPRDRLWQAQTPQLFPWQRLRTALEQACSEGVTVTDEAQAIERLGGQPLLVPGDPANLKITQPEDFALAAAILQAREAAAAEATAP